MKNLTVLVIAIIFTSSINAQGLVRADEIIEKINNGEKVLLENSIIEGDLDFTQVDNRTYANINVQKFNSNDLQDVYDRTSDNYYVDINTRVEFISCEFEGNVTGYRFNEEENTMYNARFNDKVQFANCTFSKEVNFKYSVFAGDTELESSFVEGESNFKFAQFEAIADFSRTSFKSISDFKCSSFGDLAIFQSTEFFTKAKFSQAVFADAVYFTETTFAEKAMFTYTKFKKAVFNEAKFDLEGSFTYAEFTKKAEFINAKFQDLAKFDNASFDEVDFEGTKFNIIPIFTNTLVKNMDIFSYKLQN